MGCLGTCGVLDNRANGLGSLIEIPCRRDRELERLPSWTGGAGLHPQLREVHSRVCLLLCGQVSKIHTKNCHRLLCLRDLAVKTSIGGAVRLQSFKFPQTEDLEAAWLGFSLHLIHHFNLARSEPSRAPWCLECLGARVWDLDWGSKPSLPLIAV